MSIIVGNCGGSSHNPQVYHKPIYDSFSLISPDYSSESDSDGEPPVNDVADEIDYTGKRAPKHSPTRKSKASI